MSPDQSIVLRLEVDRYAEPITGTLTEGEAEGRSFTGWLGLTDAIEAIRAAHGQSPTGGVTGRANVWRVLDEE